MKILMTLLMWGCQLGVAFILAMAGLGKLQGSEMDIALFTELNMEPGGRVIIGICELCSAAGLLHPLSAAYSALLGAAVLTGAGLAHLGPLGAEGLDLYLPTYSALLLILIMRRGELPFSSSRAHH